MEANFWHERWKSGRTAFHESDGSDLLRRHLGALHLSPGARVFVPLAGKTRDIAWLLGQGYRVAASELSDLAVSQLFEDLDFRPEVTRIGPLAHHAAPGIDVFAGDFFELTAGLLGTADAVYDRAALVALPEDMRRRYTAHLTEITGTAPQVLISFEYTDPALIGPPFSVEASEIHRHYDTAYSVHQLEHRAAPGGLRGIDAVFETVWHLAPLTPDP